MDTDNAVLFAYNFTCVEATDNDVCAAFSCDNPTDHAIVLRQDHGANQAPDLEV
jgi:hypothetical protein